MNDVKTEPGLIGVKTRGRKKRKVSLGKKDNFSISREKLAKLDKENEKKILRRSRRQIVISNRKRELEIAKTSRDIQNLRHELKKTKKEIRRFKDMSVSYQVKGLEK